MKIESFTARDNAVAIQEKTAKLSEHVYELFLEDLITHEEKEIIQGILDSAEVTLGRAIVEFEKSKL